MAKEEIAGVFGTLTSMTGAEIAISGGGSAALELIGSEIFGGSKLAGYSFMVFNLLCAPCFAACGAIGREMNDGKWTAFTLAYMTGFAYAVSFSIYNIGSLFTGTLLWWEPITAAISLAIISLAVYLMVRRGHENIKKTTYKA